MDQATRDQLSNRLAGVYEDLVSLVVQHETLERYVGKFSLAYAVDETLARLGGESAASTYFGCPISIASTVLSRLEAMQKTVDDVLKEIDKAEK